MHCRMASNDMTPPSKKNHSNLAIKEVDSNQSKLDMLESEPLMIEDQQEIEFLEV